MKKINNLQLIAIHFINELKAIFTDKGALLILIGAVLIYPLVYSIAYLNETMTELSVGVVDLDHSSISREYTQMIDATSELKVSYKPEDLEVAKNLFMSNKISGVIVIPEGFEKDIQTGTQANAAVYADASYFLKYRNTILAATYANAGFSRKVAVTRYLNDGKSMQQAVIGNDPLTAQTHILYNPSSGYSCFIMPGMIIVIIQQTLLIGIGLLGGSFSESKESPFVLPVTKRRREILPYITGKTGAYLLISLFNIA
ncbi:MAG TPA: ABC transporter permease, partial [Prolixibacteraceae bacterium]|nr:ABC transporter permease [Prolixibacteraceae bacterium]